MTDVAFRAARSREFDINGGEGDSDMYVQTPSFPVQKPAFSGSVGANRHQQRHIQAVEDSDDDLPLTENMVARRVPRNSNHSRGGSFDSVNEGSSDGAAPLKNKPSSDGSFHGVYTQPPGERVHEQRQSREWKPPIQPYKPPLPAHEQPSSVPASSNSDGAMSAYSGSGLGRNDDSARVQQTKNPSVASPPKSTQSGDPVNRSAPAPEVKGMTTSSSSSSILKCRTLDESLHNTYGSSEMKPNSTRRTSRRSIQFHTIAIREYARCVGDNPSCSAGPPMSISWEYRQALTMPVEIYEDARPPRRDHFELVLPRKIRQDMLKVEWNISQREIAEAVRTNVRVKNQRKATVNNLGATTIRIEEFFESLSRKIRRILSFQKRVGKQVEEMMAMSQRAMAQRQLVEQNQRQ